MESFEVKHLRYCRVDCRRGEATEMRVLAQYLPSDAPVVGSKSLIYWGKSPGGTSLAKLGQGMRHSLSYMEHRQMTYR